MENIQTLAHTSWNCKYHIVFAPKFRRKVFYGEKRQEIGKILRSLCELKKITIIEAEVCPDHVHMLLEIPPKFAVSSVVGFLKGKSSVQLYERFPELKFKYKNREFWCRGYYVDTAGKNAVKIANYIRHQLDEDRFGEQLTMMGKLQPACGHAGRDRTPVPDRQRVRRVASILGLCPYVKNRRLRELNPKSWMV